MLEHWVCTRDGPESRRDGRDVGLGFSRPFGTRGGACRGPNTEVLGYSRVSLRDKGMAPLQTCKCRRNSSLLKPHGSELKCALPSRLAGVEKNAMKTMFSCFKERPLDINPKWVDIRICIINC